MGFHHHFAVYLAFTYLQRENTHPRWLRLRTIEKVALTKPKTKGPQFSFFGMKPTRKTTKIVSRLTEADQKGYLLFNEVLLGLKLGQRLDEFYAVAGPKCALGEFIWIFCILFTHDRVLSFTYQKRTLFYSPLIF